MISFNCNIDNKHSDALQDIIDNVGCEMWESKKICDYRYNATINVENNDSSIYVGWYHNSKPRHDAIDLKIEYNPNKIHDYGIIKNLLNLSKMVYVKRIDYAIDVNSPISSVLFCEARKQVNVYKGTYYIGARSCGVKIYDKALEQHLENTVLTRVEYRIPFDCQVYPEMCVSSSGIIFPDIKFLEVDLTMDAETVLLLEGLRVRPELFKALSYYKKQKIKKMSESLPQINFQRHQRNINRQLEQYINSLYQYNI